MNRFIALSFLVLCATEGLQAARAAEPIQIFLDQESANPVSKKLRKGKYATVRTIKNEDTLAAARRLLDDKPLVLNMADDITPGGFLNSGGRAQEVKYQLPRSRHGYCTHEM